RARGVGDGEWRPADRHSEGDRRRAGSAKIADRRIEQRTDGRVHGGLAADRCQGVAACRDRDAVVVTQLDETEILERLDGLRESTRGGLLVVREWPRCYRA